jgi:hypothetical protein
MIVRRFANPQHDIFKRLFQQSRTGILDTVCASCFPKAFLPYVCLFIFIKLIKMSNRTDLLTLAYTLVRLLLIVQLLLIIIGYDKIKLVKRDGGG